jgi:SH3-like domain-containing protein
VDASKFATRFENREDVMGRLFLGVCLTVSLLMCVSCAEMAKMSQIAQSLKLPSSANNSSSSTTNQLAAQEAAVAEQQASSGSIINVKQGKSVNVRKEPTTAGKNVIATINHTTQLEKLDEQGDWTKVRFSDGKGKAKEGWVSTKLIDIRSAQTASNAAPPMGFNLLASIIQPKSAATAEVNPVASAGTPSLMDNVNKMSDALGGNDVDALLNYVESADNTFKKSIDALFTVVGTEEDRAKINMELEAANGIQDPKEKEAKIKEIETEKEAAVKKAVNESDCKDKCKALDKQKRKLYANAVYNVFLCAKFNACAVEHSLAITQKCSSNPVLCAGIVFKLGKLASIAASLPKQIQNIVQFGTTLSQIGSAAHIEIQQPKSEKEKPKEVEIG